MKLLFLLCLIYLNYGSTQNFPEKRYLVKSMPKKVHPGMFRINFSNKYINQQKLDKLGHHEFVEAKTYTVFMPIDKKSIADVPESLLFANDLLPEQKTRVKKVLPDYAWSLARRKRSVDNNAANRRAPFKSKKGKPKSRGHRNRKKSKKGKKGSRMKQFNRSQRASDLKRPKNNKPRLRSKSSRDTKAKRNPDARRLIAARDATIEEYPYVVSIQKNKEHWCSGALLNPRLIITTANCMWKGSQISRMKVRVGSRYTNQGGQVFKIQEVMRHPGWMIRNNPDCDVALALLDGNVRFSHSVHGVDLPNHAMMPPFDDAWVTSWGSERRDGVYDSQSTTLQVYHVHLMDRDKCNNITERFRVSVTENFVCLAQTGGRAPCTRDTGAPAVSDGVVWGLASWGIRKLCGTGRYPSMFSYLASRSNLEFITNATHLLMADQRNYPYLDKWSRMRVTPSTPTTITMPY